MKLLGITQRVEVITDYKERRDCLDQRWAPLAEALDFIPFPLSNLLSGSQAAGDLSVGNTDKLIKELKLDAVIFSGGNSLASYDSKASDAAPERDAFEAAMLKSALANDIPVLGVCRGMQLINVELGGGISRTSTHAGTYHKIIANHGTGNDFEGELPAEVNSYHNWLIKPEQLAPACTPLAFDQEGCVEAFRYNKGKVAGMMWHPERETPFKQEDITLIKSLLI